MQKSFELRSREEELSGLRKRLGALLERCGFTPHQLEDVVLAVDEAVTNTMEHGYGHDAGRIDVVIEDLGDRVQILIRDFSHPFDPTTLPDPELPPTRVGGLGVHFIRSTMDDMEYRRGPNQANELILTKLKTTGGRRPTG